MQVKSHIRKRRNKVSVISKHFRKDVSEFKKVHNIQTPIKIKGSKDSVGSSEAHTDSTMLNGVPIHHDIKIEKNKIVPSELKKVVHHELGHVLEREKKVLSTKKGKTLLKKIKGTKSFKKLKTGYQKNKEEVFARAYAQKKVGASKNDIKTGENLTKKEFSKVKKYLK